MARAKKVNRGWKTLAILLFSGSAITLTLLSFASNQRYANLQQAHLESLERQSELYDRLSRMEAERITGQPQQAPEKPQDFTPLILGMMALCGFTVVASSGAMIGLKILSNRQNLEILQAMHVEKLKAIQDAAKPLKSAAVKDSEDDEERRIVEQIQAGIDPESCRWIEHFVKSSFHFRVCGSTGAGKSVFVKNLLDLVAAKFKIPHIEDFVRIIDPKFTDAKNWGKFIPAYQTIEQAYQGICDMEEMMKERLAIAQTAANAKQPAPDFFPIFWIIDESDWVMTEHKRKGIQNKFRTVLKVARALKIIVIFLGQSPLCSTLGLFKSDFDNCGSIFLGYKTAIRALDDMKGNKKQKAELTAQLEELREMNDAYFALVDVNKSPLYLAPLPPPNYIKEIQARRSVGDAITIESSPIATQDRLAPADTARIPPKALPEGKQPVIADSIRSPQNSPETAQNEPTLSTKSRASRANPDVPSSLSDEERVKLASYWELKKNGTNTKKALVKALYPEIRGTDKQGSRGYRKALKMLEALPGVSLD